MGVVVFLLVLLLSLQQASCALTKTYSNCQFLSVQNNIKLHWTVNGDNTISLGVEANVNGYVAVGLSKDGTMSSGGINNQVDFSDAWVASMNNYPGDPCNPSCLLDMYLPDQDQPRKDLFNDLTNVVVSKAAGVLSAEWTRLLDTGHLAEDYPIDVNNPMIVIWAAHPTIPVAKNNTLGLIPLHRVAGLSLEGNRIVNFGQPSTCSGNGTGGGGGTKITPLPPPVGPKYVSTDGSFTIIWQVDQATQSVHFSMSATQKGWISIAFSDTKLMSPNDMVVGWVDGTGAITLIDTWSPDYLQPRDDIKMGGTDDVTLTGGSEVNGVTTITFKRPLRTGDQWDYDLSTSKDIHIIWAWCITDGVNGVYDIHQAYSAAGVVNIVKGTIGAQPIQLTPGNVLLIIMAGLLGIWVIIRMLHKLQKYLKGKYKKYQKKNKKGSEVALSKAASSSESSPRITPGSNDSSNRNSPANYPQPGPPRPPAPINNKRPQAYGQQPYDQQDNYQNNYPQNNYPQSTGNNWFDVKVDYEVKALPSDNRATVVIPDRDSARLIGPRPQARNVKGKPPVGYYPNNRTTKVLSPTRLTQAFKPNYDAGPVQNNVFTGGYYRGSMVVVPKDIRDKQERRFQKEVKRMTELAQSHPEVKIVANEEEIDIIEAKSSGNAVTNLADAILNARVPKTQITIGFLISFILFVGINVGCLFLEPQWYVSFGSLASANALLVALPAARNSVTVYLLGLPFDRTILYHRWLGRWTILISTIHFGLSLLFWYQNNLPFGQQSATLKHATGYVAWAIFFVLLCSSIDYMRRTYYEVFHWIHYVFVLYYIFGALHSQEVKIYVIIAAIIFVLDYGIRALWGSLPMKTLEIHYKEGDIIQVKFSKRTAARLLKLHKVGQYMFLNFPMVSLLEWHPFSISSGPDEKTLEVHIKALGDHTTKLVNLARTKGTMYIRTDGPYGNAKFNYRRFPCLVLVAGGIGITPIIGMIKDAYRYGDIATKKTHKSVVEKIVLVWTVQNMPQFGWFSEELKYCYNASKSEGFPKLELQIYVTKHKGELQGFFTKGRPDFESIFERVVTQFPDKASTVFTCGPRKMVNDCWDAVNIWGRTGHSFHFHHETFEF